MTWGSAGWLDDEDWKTLETQGLPDRSRIQEARTATSPVYVDFYCRRIQRLQTLHRRVLDERDRPCRVPQARRRRHQELSVVIVRETVTGSFRAAPAAATATASRPGAGAPPAQPRSASAVAPAACRPTRHRDKPHDAA